MKLNLKFKFAALSSGFVKLPETRLNTAPHLALPQSSDTDRCILVECDAPKHFCPLQRPSGERQ